MKIRIMTLLCIAIITMFCNAMFKESEVIDIADDSTESAKKFRAYLSDGHFLSGLPYARKLHVPTFDICTKQAGLPYANDR